MAGGRHRAFLSSGTWSLLGTEVDAPIITPRSRELNFTNEGGVSGTTRLLKNIAGMWLLQACRRTWAAAGQPFEYDELLTMAADDRPGVQGAVRPGPRRASSTRATWSRRSPSTAARPAQPVPDGPGGYTRAILESLAFKYRFVIDSLRELTGHDDRGDADRRRRVAQPAAESVHRRRDRLHRPRRPDRSDGARQRRDADGRQRRRRLARATRAASSSDRSRSSGSRRATPIAGTHTIDDFNSIWS